jgi:hypothetical protein
MCSTVQATPLLVSNGTGDGTCRVACSEQNCFAWLQENKHYSTSLTRSTHGVVKLALTGCPVIKRPVALAKAAAKGGIGGAGAPGRRGGEGG